MSHGAVRARKELVSATRLELGCGNNKRPGFFGIDIAPGEAVDRVLDIEREPLPFADDSVDYIYSSHTFEHLEAPGSPCHTLREIVRVGRHAATVEIWTPFGKSDPGFLFGHRVFYSDTHWKHICYEYDGFYLGEGRGRFQWMRTQYLLYPGILETLQNLNVPIEFAITHMVNVVLEFGVFLAIDKTLHKARAPQYPIREICYERYKVLRTL
jgi:SAM-dependent methyltransferase